MPKFTFKYVPNRPLFRRPEILTHPHIPMAMAGVNPRSIKGRDWWDEIRREAYSANRHCCHACGISAGDDPYRGPLEAHEAYDFDYENATMKLREVVALCNSCHNYIHSGRVWANYQDGNIELEQLKYILRHGGHTLMEEGLYPFIFTVRLTLTTLTRAEDGELWNYMDRYYWSQRDIRHPTTSGKRWKLHFEGKDYYGL